ncbi:hypothetical protein KM043_010744 [Ampulex compressa]|nr:hypothetical protein KM043_010744 [Ampulex compressa]
MSVLHLGSGSEKPAEVTGQARLYNMAFCPFTHRIRLILTLKKIPHDIVNINLKDKPQWYFEIHEEGKVPVFVDTDGKIVTDSMAIANYLDEKYPEPGLYNDETKARDLELIDHYSKIIDIFSNCIHSKDERSLDEIVSEISDLLAEFEEELKIRGTTFFGGENPGMLDIAMWPWVERAKSLPLIYKQTGNFNKENFPNIMKWISEMKTQEFVRAHAMPYEKFATLIENQRAGKIDFDNV